MNDYPVQWSIMYSSLYRAVAPGSTNAGGGKSIAEMPVNIHLGDISEIYYHTIG